MKTDFRIVRADSGVLYVVTVTQPATEQVVFQRLHVKRHIAGGAIRVELSMHKSSGCPAVSTILIVPLPSCATLSIDVHPDLARDDGVP